MAQVADSVASSPSAAAPQTDGHRVYVGNLAWKVQWQDLKDHMRKRGGNVIRADVFQDAVGRSLGCGLVEYETAEEARDAIEHLTDSELFDRKIFVREDREEARRGSPEGFFRNGGVRGGRGGAAGGGRGAYLGAGGPAPLEDEAYRRPPPPVAESRRRPETGDTKDCQVFVGNLPYRATWQDLKSLFNEDNAVVRADVYEHNGRSRGCGTVLFKDPAHAQDAIERFNEHELMGRKIFVRLDTRSSSMQKGGAPPPFS